MNIRALQLAAVLVALTGLAAFAAAPNPEPWNAPVRAAHRKNPVLADAAAIAAGKALYAQECASCHGDTGKGDGPSAKDLEVAVADLASAKIQNQSDGTLFWKISEGRKPMPGMSAKWSDDQRWQVVDFVRTFKAAN